MPCRMAGRLAVFPEWWNPILFEDEGAASDPAGAPQEGDGPGSGSECPICVMFKKGGCKEQFDVRYIHVTHDV